MKPYSYEAGVCNIGPAEIRARAAFGWVGLVITLVLLGCLTIFRVPHLWRLFVFLPASMSASGFLQAYFHFCAGFESRGVYYFGAIVGKTEAVTDANARKKDLEKSRNIGLLSAAIGAVAAALAVLLPF